MEAFGYTLAMPHLILDLGPDETLIPDFFVRRIDQTWEIIELKRADTQVLKNQLRRRTFYASMETYYQQCIYYADFFSDSKHRDAFAKRYPDIRVEGPPRTTLVAGRSEGFDRYAAYKILRDRGMKVDHLTYDDVRDRLEFYRINCLGSYENLKGISAHLVLILHKLENQENFILDIGADNDRDRLSIYLTPKDELVFRILDSSGLAHSFRVERQPGAFDYNQLMYLLLEFGIGEDYSMVSIEVDGVYHSSTRVENLKFGVSPTHLPSVIGSDVNGSASSALSLVSKYLCSRTLTMQEKLDFIYYVYDKHSMFWEDRSQWPQRVEFLGRKFMYSNRHPNFAPVPDNRGLFQPETARSPVSRMSGPASIIPTTEPE